MSVVPIMKRVTHLVSKGHHGKRSSELLCGRVVFTNEFFTWRDREAREKQLLHAVEWEPLYEGRLQIRVEHMLPWKDLCPECHAVWKARRVSEAMRLIDGR